jgi:hypothetical protein
MIYRSEMLDWALLRVAASRKREADSRNEPPAALSGSHRKPPALPGDIYSM